MWAFGSAAATAPGVALPHIHTDPRHRGFQRGWNRLQKGLYRGLQPVGQHRQDVGVPLGLPRPDHRHVGTMALEQRHFVDPQGIQGGVAAPVHGGRDVLVHDPLHRLDPQVALPTDIGHRAMNQPFQHVLLESPGMGSVGLIPATALGAGRSPLTGGTAVAFGADLDQYFPAKHRQVAQADRSVEPMKPVNLPATAIALGRAEGAFHLDQQGGIRQHLGGQHPDIRQIQGQANRDRHCQHSTRVRTCSAFHTWASNATPLHLVAFTGDLIEPKAESFDG